MPRAAIDLDTLSADQMNALVVYLTGLINAINEVDVTMFRELLEAGDMSDVHALVIDRWQFALVELNTAMTGNIERMTSRVSLLN